MNNLKQALALVAVLAAMAFASTGDYDHAVQQQNHYAEMVCSGHWPNYKKIEVNCMQTQTDAHEQTRQQLQQDVQKFLDTGGKIQKVSGFTAVTHKRVTDDYDPAAVTNEGEELLTVKAIVSRYGKTKYEVRSKLPPCIHRIKNPSCFTGNRKLNAWPKSVVDSIFLDAGSAKFSESCTTICDASEYWGITKNDISNKVQRGVLPPFDGTDPQQFWTRKTWQTIPLHEHLKPEPEELENGIPVKDIAEEFGVNTYTLTKMMRNSIIPGPDGVMSTQNSSGNYYTVNAYTRSTAEQVRAILNKNK